MFRPAPEALDRCEHHHRARFSASHRASEVVVTVEGEVDATNSRAMATYVESQLLGVSHLVLDLRLVDFFGTAGFAALHNINVVCARSGVTWRLRCGRQVRRLLAICNPEAALPLEKPQSVLDDLRAGDRALA
ncbi:STAS domain-containing protein [Mycolicibacterium pulveris]|nr:STAS domain-containing protein [Mycolicibacterium pulveris]